MVREALPPGMAEQIDAKSAELSKEFYEHAAAFHEHLKTERPDLLERNGLDVGKVFEGWCIQKLASLQLIVLQLVERVETLESRRNK
jgi:hypothetical protein